MQLLKEFPQHLCIITSVLIIISYWCYYAHKNFKIKEASKLSAIYSELEQEHNLRKKLSITDEQMIKIKKETQQNLQKIKVDIVNLDFSFSEIFF